MGIFTTREIAIFIYALFLLAYILIRKKGKSIVLPVIKAACHMKLIIPFFIVLLFAAGFIWGCTYLPCWDWIYVKDIIFWTLFVGAPVCFNATSRQLEEQYFKNILINNLKFTALVEFITGTFTFHIIGELILQPILVFLMILQSSLINKTEAVQKFIDRLVGISGLIILGLTIKSVVDSIGNIQFIDITVGFLLPIILSTLYLPVSYIFAVYAKYEILFLRMGFKDPDDQKLKRKHRIEVILCCKLSYKKICKFLNEYVQKMYVNMSTAEFATIIDQFRGTNEHTYYAVIKHNGKYYVSRTSTSNFEFTFEKFTINKGGLFKNSNKELRKEIALQIQKETPYRNTNFTDKYTHYPVSLRKMFLFTKGSFFKRTKIAIFISNALEKGSDSVELPFGEGVKEQSNKNTVRLMRALKWDALWAPFLAISIYFILFLLASFLPYEPKVNLDLAAFIFAVIIQLRSIFHNKTLVFKVKLGQKLIYLQNIFTCCGVQELFIFFISLFISYILQPFDISSSTLSKLGIAFLFSGILIDIWKRDQ